MCPMLLVRTLDHAFHEAGGLTPLLQDHRCRTIDNQDTETLETFKGCLCWQFENDANYRTMEMQQYVSKSW